MMQRLMGLFLLLALVAGPARATRLRTIGFEVGFPTGGGPVTFEGGTAQTGTTWSAATVRSGTHALSISTLTDVSEESISIGPATSSEFGTAPFTLYQRVYFYFEGYPSATNVIWVPCGSTTVKITHTGSLQLFFAGVQQGSDSAAIPLNTWTRVELRSKIAASGTGDERELRVNGSTVAQGLSLTATTSVITGTIGWYADGISVGGGVGANVVMRVDDIAYNNDSGAAQNSWPGEGKIVVLLPTSDNARTGWTAGGGGTTSLFSAVKNTPPVGVLVGTNTSQIKDLVSSTTDNYDANLTTYTAAGLVSTDTITLVQAICSDGEQAATGTKTGALQIVSNPTQAVEDGFTFGDDGGAIGTWPTNWRGHWGTAQVSPSVTRGTAPVLRMGKRTATTREVDTAFMGLSVEYVNAVIASSAPRLPLLGVGHP